MTRQLASEFTKITTTRTLAGLLAGMLGLVALAICLHAVGLPLASLSSRPDQRGIVIDVAVNLGAVFAALAGALSITTEFRSGTIRPVLLVTPRRATVLWAKAGAVLLTGLLAGLLSAAAADGVGRVALGLRGVTVRLTAHDDVLLLAGGAAAGAMLAVIGLAVGAVVRAQVPTVVVLLTWLLFVENLLAEVPRLHRYLPGALAQAAAGQDRNAVLHAPGAAAALLVLYAGVTLVVATTLTGRRDVG